MFNYQKFTLGGPMMNQFVLQSCFFKVLPGHVNIMRYKGYNHYDKCTAICVHLSSQEEPTK